MNKARKRRSKRRRKQRAQGIVGRQAKIRMGQEDINVIILEDRGNVGYAGRRLVRVQLADPQSDPSITSFEIPADDLILQN
jgi:hypothetical protein